MSGPKLSTPCACPGCPRLIVLPRPPLAESSLLEQLALLSNPTPVDLDPEEAYSSLSSSKQTKAREADDEDDDDAAEDAAAGREHYLAVGCVVAASSLRARELVPRVRGPSS